MALTAHLCTTMELNYTDRCGRERNVDVIVEYAFNGDDDLAITGLSGPYSDWDEDLIVDMIYGQLEETAPEAYSEWLADYGEYLSDCALDRRAAA